MTADSISVWILREKRLLLTYNMLLVYLVGLMRKVRHTNWLVWEEKDLGCLASPSSFLLSYGVGTIRRSHMYTVVWSRAPADTDFS